MWGYRKIFQTKKHTYIEYLKKKLKGVWKFYKTCSPSFLYRNFKHNQIKRNFETLYGVSVQKKIAFLSSNCGGRGLNTVWAGR